MDAFVPQKRKMRRSVFWRVAGILVGVQVATGLMAVALSAWIAYDRGLDLVANSIRLRLDRLATEVEQRTFSLDAGLANLPLGLRLDFARRFPDPVYLLDADGNMMRNLTPGTNGISTQPAFARDLPINPGLALRMDSIFVQLNPKSPGGTWSLTPLYKPDGALAGGIVVRPLTLSIDRELESAREAFFRTMWVVAGMAVLIALLLGAFFTWRLVRPLRRMTERVEKIGAGDFSERLEELGDDEFGRLARAINQMATEVQNSIGALQATDRLRRELIANIGHDLRTPLSAMLGYVEEARQKSSAGKDEAAHDALETAARQGDYLRRLVSDLFELSLLDHVAPVLRCEPVPIGELLRDAAAHHQKAFAEADIFLDLSLPPALPIIEGDGVRLLRVIDNLLSNARRHTDAGGKVILRAKAIPTEICIEVEDTGRGMTPEILDNIFERYYRGTDARTRATKGTGLGLPISLAIARAHGGDLVAKSTPGKGSIFTVHLPIKTVADVEVDPEPMRPVQIYA